MSNPYQARAVAALASKPSGWPKRIAHLVEAVAAGGASSAYLRGKIDDALARSGVQVPHPPEKVETVDDEPTVFVRREVVLSESMRPQALRLHREHSRAHALMCAAHDRDERARWAKAIMDHILPKLDALYDAARAGVTEYAPDGDHQPVVDPKKRLKTLRTMVSRLRNQSIPNAPTVARRQKLQNDLSAYLSEIKYLTHE